MSKDDPLHAVHEARRRSDEDEDNDRSNQMQEYVERSALIVLGLTITVLAGFLSQVWGSAGIPFRTELAGTLKDSGQNFLLAFTLPYLRYFASLNYLWRRAWWYSWIMTAAWTATMLFVGIRFLMTLHTLGDTILKFAKLPST